MLNLVELVSRAASEAAVDGPWPVIRRRVEDTSWSQHYKSMHFWKKYFSGVYIMRFDRQTPTFHFY